ncbi:MAG: hypothetical protein RSA66_11070, partial [Muribaculaceae bacterium]
ENDKIKRIFIGEKAPKLTRVRCGLQHLASIGFPYTNEVCICYIEFNTAKALYDSSYPFSQPPENENVSRALWTTDERIGSCFYVEP